jgi:NAD(P)H-flavin reductase/ferredoxin
MSFEVRLEGTDIAFACADGQTVLDAAASAGIELPYSCRKGVCGNCAGRVLQGELRGARGLNLRNETCTPEQVLFCAGTPTSDVLLEPTAWHRVDPTLRKRIKTKVYRHQQPADDVSILQLRLPMGQRAKFKAGQYLQLRLDDGSERSYSMASAPHESDMITLHIRHVPGGRFSAMLPTLQAGTALEVELPYGNFSLREETQAQDAAAPLVFVAGGTGFAPIKSIIDDMIKRGIRRPITLFWGARKPEHLYLMAAVEKWQKQLPDFRFVAALSDEGVALPDGAFAGFVHDALAARVDTLVGHELYVCGSPPMVAAVREVAERRLELAPCDFHSDVFVTAAPEATTASVV